jgi:phosphoglycolate phosphatase-like HAD superfamily hydrolase
MDNRDTLEITKKFIVATDADGVIWNTVDECFHIAYPVFKRMKGEIPVDETFLTDRFRKGRFLAKNGEDFFIILHLLKTDPGIDFSRLDFKDINKLRIELKNELDEFGPAFYQEREKLQEENPEGWLSLQNPYPGVLEQLPEIRTNFLDLVICTTKDTKSINMLLEDAGQSYTVYGREFSTFKPDQMKRISEVYSVSPARILFIDDLLENLIPVKQEGVNTFLADWGYNNPGEYAKAEESGIIILKQEKITDQLAGYCLRKSHLASQI